MRSPKLLFAGLAKRAPSLNCSDTWGSLFLKTMFLALIACAVPAFPALAQTGCPPGYTAQTKIVQVVYQGVCCNVKVEYCEKLTGTMLDIIITAAEVPDASCWGISPGSPAPFGVNYIMNLLREKVIKEAFPGQIPICPTQSTVVIGTSVSECAEWLGETYDPDGPNGPLPELYRLYLSFCSEATCYRECTVCLNPNELDPCTNEPKLLYNCSVNIIGGCVGIQGPTNCFPVCGS